MIKKGFCFKNPFFAQNAIFSKIMSKSKDCFGYAKAHTYPSIYLEMGELQLRLLEKQLKTKFFLFWGKKAIFSQKGHFFAKMAAQSK